MPNAEVSGRFKVVAALKAAFLAGELVVAWWINSLTLFADAAHTSADLVALGIGIFAAWFARRPPGPQHTYGYYRSEILAALGQATLLSVLATFILIEAIERLRHPVAVPGPALIGVAVVSLAVNFVCLRLLRKAQAESLHMRGAWLSMVADTIGSLGIVVGGGLIWALGWTWVDPAVSLLLVGLLAFSIWELLLQSSAVLMERAPERIDVDRVREAIRELAGVEAVYDLHVWSIASGLSAMSAHVVHSERAEPGDLLEAIHALLHRRFGITHVTVQLQSERFEQAHVPF